MSGPRLSHDEWLAKKSSLTFRTKAFINGRFVDAQSGETFTKISPIDGTELCQVAACDTADVDAAVQSARTAFNSGSWAQMAPKKRKKVMQRFAALIEDNAAELALLETLDMGKPIREASNVDIPLSAECIAWFGECLDKYYDEIAPTDANALALVTREPIGVVAAVVPWNFPLLMAAWKLGPALAAGNSVILKPAEQSPLSALRIAELAVEAGLPEGVLNVVPGLGEHAGKAIGLHMDIDAVTFTGSTEVGKYFLLYAGQSNMKQVSLECGGKSPHIVMADAGDLDVVARYAAFGIFYNQGQVCTAGSRLLVQESIHDELMEKIIGFTSTALQPGDPLNPKTRIGSIVDENQMKRVLGYIEAGQNAGADLLIGGQQVLTETGGFYVAPTIFDKVDSGMRIAQEEIFGPVLSTITFKDAEEALKIANDTIYGLAAAVWSRDISTAHKTAAALRAGTIWVNCYDHGDISVPFGGFKQSGFGRDKSIHALEKYSQLKTTWINLA